MAKCLLSPLVNYNDSLVTAKRFEDGLVVGCFFSKEQEELYVSRIGKLYQQFDKGGDVAFLSFFADTSQTARDYLRQFIADNSLEDEEQNYFFQGTREEMERLARDCHLPFGDKGMSLSDNSLLFFADSLMVRGFYDMKEEEDLKKLVKHITLNIPPQKDKELYFEREVEK